MATARQRQHDRPLKAWNETRQTPLVEHGRALHFVHLTVRVVRNLAIDDRSIVTTGDRVSRPRSVVPAEPPLVTTQAQLDQATGISDLQGLVASGDTWTID